MSENHTQTEVRSTPAILAPFTSIARELRGLLDVPIAFFGGLVGMVVLSAGLLAFLVYAPQSSASEAEDEEDLLEIDFQPGELVKLGKKPEDLEKVIVQETHVEAAATQETITKEDKAPPEDLPPKEKEKPNDSKVKPDPDKDKKSKKSDKDREKNTPYDDLPNADEDIGDPFGDAEGWGDLFKEGDPWATQIMKELNNLQLGTFAAQSKKGNFEFRLTVCKDGKLDVKKKAGTDGDLWDAIKYAVGRIKIKVPMSRELQKQMSKECQPVKGNFTWRDGRVYY